MKAAVIGGKGFIGKHLVFYLQGRGYDVKTYDIIPVEVKADTNIKSRSLKKYAETFEQETKLRVRFSMNNFRMDEGVLNIPLFMADQADRLIGIALGETHEK